MKSIPPTPLILGLLGVLPFMFGVIAKIQNPAFGHAVLSMYGLIILCFMSGVLWGFATTSPRGWPYTASVLPAIYAFFALTFTPSHWHLQMLAVGYVFVYALDILFARSGLTPPWWIPLRSLLTAIVLVCLIGGMIL